MSLKNRRFILCLLLGLGFTLSHAQTLYWVGGSGNFNDPNHWSLSSAGEPSGLMPGPSSNLVFDNSNDFSPAEITLNGTITVNSINVTSYRKVKLLALQPGARLIIKNNFNNLIDNLNFKLALTLEFSSQNIQNVGYINLGNETHNADVLVSAGKWKINNLKLLPARKLEISNSKINFQDAFVESGWLELKNCNYLDFNKAVLKIRNEIKVENCQNYSIKKSFIGNRFYDGQQDTKLGLAAVAGKFSNNNQTNAVCWTASLVTAPSCFPGCDGVVVVTLPALNCWNTPAVGAYDIQFSSGCAAITGSSNVGPGTYTFTGFCGCISQYNVAITDLSTSTVFPSPFLVDNNGTSIKSINVAFPSISLISSSSKSVSCFGACDGSVSANFFGGTPPYTFTVAAPSVSTSFSTSGGSVSRNSLCAGIVTITAADANSCAIVYTRTIATPTVVSANVATINPICRGDANGGFSVAPTGGTPNYTINFSSGATLSTTAGGTVSVNTYTGGVVTATITDSKGCTAIVTRTLTAPPSYTITTSQTSVSCPGQCTGAGSLNVTGGVSPYSYTWNPSGGNSAGATSLCAQVYTVNVRDNTGCLTSRTVNVTQPTSLTISSNTLNVTCNGASTGAATVTASGPTTAISFTWITLPSIVISTLNTISGRAAGVYTVFIKDAATNPTCVSTRTISISQPPTFSVTPTTQSISCATNTCTGGATITATGGNGSPYTYSWTPGAITTSAATSLCSGTYIATVRDASNCPSSANFTITQPPAIVFGISTRSIACFGATTGSIGVSPSGGLAPYTFTLVSTSSTLTSGPSFTNLTGGTYTLFVKDNTPGACAQTTVITLGTAPNLLAAISTGSVKCFGASTGSLTGNPVGGTPGYTLTWTTPSGTVAGSSITNRAAGNYTLTIRDAQTCSITTVTTITQPTADITFTVTSTPALCHGGASGVLSANASGGTPGYTFVWSNGFTGNPNTGLLASGSPYSYTITDANGCTKTSTASVSQPSPIVLVVTTSSTSCSGGSNGSATIVASGGTSPFSYTFNTSPASTATTNTTGIILNLMAGPHTATVRDANSCSQPTVFTIAQPALLTAAITGTQNSCTACTGAATVTGSNGSPGYTYLWKNSLNATVSTSAVASALCTGNYTVTVTDSKSCTATTTVNIQQTVISAAVLGGTGIQCFGLCTGSAVAVPSGGSGIYNYTWTPSGQTTQTATGLCAQTYTVNIKEVGGAGCSSFTTINVSGPTAMAVTTLQSNLTCFSVCTGSISASVSGGTGVKSFTWLPGGQNTSSIINQCASGYTLNIRDANNCTLAPITFSLTQPTPIVPNFSNTVPTGCTLNNGSICVSPTGGSGSGYTFTWSPVTNSTSCLSGLSSGSYSVTIKDGSGCSAVSSTVLNSPSGPTITATQKSVTCSGASTGGATITALGTPAFSYTWSPAVAGNTPIVNGIPSGTYVVTVRDGNSCVTNASVVVNSATSLTLNPLPNNSRCAAGAPTGSVGLSPAGATPSYSYAWSGPAFTATTQNITNLVPGFYSLTLTDANACVTTTVFNITAPPAITVTANSAQTVICNSFTNGAISATAAGGVPPLSLTWTPVGAFTGSTTSTVLNLGPGVYSVFAIDANTCLSAPAIWTLAASTLSSSIVSQSATCSNSNNATATLNVSGGAPTYSFSWSTGTSTTNVLSNIGVGNYTATVVDADGCVSQNTLNISSVSLFTLTATPSHPKCNASCNGSITVNPSGAVGTITYSWSPTGSGQNPTGLCANNYILVATDANSCNVTSIITLTNPPAMAAFVTTVSPTCNGVCNGSAVVTTTNSVGTLSVSWLPTGPNSATITNLCDDNYTVNVQDANGCVDSQTFIITDPSSISINPAVAPASCGSSNGSITVLPSGGTPGYTFTWNPGVSTSSSATGLAAQIYTVTVKDNANCTSSVTIPVGNSNGPTAVVSATNVNCFGKSTGAVSIGSLSGGTLPYQPAVWITPSPSVVSNSLTNIPVGNYTVQLEDNLGCITFTGAVITSPSSISVIPSMGLPTCNGVCNGSVSLNVSGGVPAYSYSWSPAAPNTSVLTGLCAGPYTVDISHNGGACTESVTFNVPGQVNLTFTDNVVQNTCFGNCNAAVSVSIIPTAGIPSPFLFSWSNGQTSPGPLSGSISSLCNNTYSLVATGANGCFSTYSVNITSSSQLSIAATVTQPSCNLANGSVTVTPGGGSGSTYSLNWSNGATTPTLGNLIAGFYQLTITDNIGCSQTTLVSIDNSSGITDYTVTTLDIPCGATCTGAATIVANGTNVPISYNWISPAINSQTLNNLCAGDYFIQMQDADGCVKNGSMTILAATSITLSPFVTAPDCGFTNGTLNVVASGGTPTYNFSWIPAAPNTGTLTNVGPGSYSLTVTDSSPGGCPTSTVLNISNVNAPTVVISPTHISCFATCTGSALANVTGTATPFTYNWSAGGTAPGLSNLCKGAITVSVTDANNCITVATTTINENPEIQLGLPAVIQPSCNLSNGQAIVNAFGGVGPYSYTWTTGATGPTLSNVGGGIYQVVVTDVFSCQKTQNILINNSNGITSHSFNVQDVTCGSSCDGGATVIPVGGNLPITFSWINPTLTTSSNAVNNLCSGIYFVQMQDNEGCLRTASTQINPATSITISPVVTQPACGVSNGVISVSAAGGTPTYNFAWVPVAPNSATLTGLGAGSYTLTVTDTSPGGCPTSTVLNISNINAPAVVLSPTHITCFATCTGSVSANVTGTATPFTYNWSAGGTASNLSNLCKGAITVSVTDANNCITVATTTINENPEIQMGLPAITQPSCNLNNGQAIVNAFGGVGPYSYTWTTGATGSTLSSVGGGFYQVIVTDAAGCQKTENILINNSNGITSHSFNVQDVTCGNNCNGGVTVTPVGGNLPISFSWINPILASNSNVVNNLCSGIYFVQMQDNQGCLRTASTNINPATSITISPVITPPACGSNNGVINVSAAGGTPTYNFAWVPLAPNSATLTGLGAGSYTLIVTDASPGGCPTSSVFNISSLNAPAIAFTATNVNCFGQCTGAVFANVTGTATPFVYNWGGGGNTPGLSNLCSGVITLTVTDTNSCVAVKATNIIENPELQTGFPTLSQPSCNQCNGQAQVNAFGGTAPYTYSWTSGANGVFIDNLCAGVYQVLIKDNLNCEVLQNIIINNSNGITGHTFAVQDVACSGNCNGSATVTPSGGTSPISFAWINPVLSNTSNSASNLCAGSYFVKMTDAQGCVRTGSTNIAALTDMTITSNVVQPDCGQTNGFISLNVTGGTTPYTFSWSPVASSASTVTGLAPGSYTVKVTDQNGAGCAETINFDLSNLSGPSLSYSQTNVSCFSLCNGSVSAISTGTAATTFSWSTGSSSANSGSTCAGIISLTASANGCQTVKSFTILRPPELEFNYNVKNLSCLNACDGLLTLQPLGGELMYVFAGTTASNTNQTSTLCAGDYTFTITDALGCQVDSVVQLKNPTPITTTLNSVNSSCSSMADGSATVVVSGGTPKYSYLWNGPASFTSDVVSISNIFSGSYTLSVTDSLGCRKDSVLQIVTTVTIEANAGRDTLACPGSSIQMSGLKSAGAVNFRWSQLFPASSLTVATTPTFALTNATDSYTFELLATSSVAGCFDRDSVVVTIYTVPYLDAGPSYTIPVFSSVTIGGNPTTGGAGTVTWSPGFTLNDVNIENPIASNSVAITYTASLAYGSGCIVSDTMQVILYPEIKINNGFSPNGDGKNDRWYIDYLEQFPDNTVEVFNRWGERLFNSKGYQTPFDGTYKGKDLPVGTYYYIIRLNHPAYPEPYTGPLTIFR